MIEKQRCIKRLIMVIHKSEQRLVFIHLLINKYENSVKSMLMSYISVCGIPIIYQLPNSVKKIKCGKTAKKL